ncbi:carbohydrate ABC transporter permease [Leifsonia aquatica]|uniref:Multiple sugar transport system permease protein n=2 Tax=Leifsonia aquatica TaxID=144185 RepID=A0A7W4US45_LEIAQ|nr:sugar ABC transporter permease [Leifsonia aquatica]ERK72452.1 putative transmembrane permease MsmF [Leifsonia aquatica ATCC 14665]MBB2965275.1 multiple sugar transport system permease protein [Leifsonia aquatica]
MTSLTRSRERKRAYRPPAPLGGRPRSGRQAPIALLFLLPALVILIAFVGWPMLSALRLSFTNASGFGIEEWVGLDNYVRVFTDPRILSTLGNTAVYTVLFTPTALIAALLLALLLGNRRLIARGIFRTALFLPFIVSLAVAAFAWTYLLDPQVGLLNYWLRSIGIQLGNVLQDPALAMPTVVLVAIWKNFGFYMVIFIAGLQEIPESLYEAAKIDGAGAWRRFISVTLPQLSNTLAFVIVFAMIAALQAFDQIYVMTGGGPYRSTQTVVMEIYQEGFKKLDLGVATALSYVLLAATLILSLVQFRFFGRREKDNA